MEKEYPIIEGIKKASMIKEAIASVELDKGQTQTFSEEPKKEFNLSEKITCLGMSKRNLGKVVPISTIKAEDVKEFIRRLKEEIENDREFIDRHVLSKEKFYRFINKIFGDKLTK